MPYNQALAVKACRIRIKLRKGKTISEKDRVFLLEYESQGPKRGPIKHTPPVTGAPSEPTGDSPPPSGGEPPPISVDSGSTTSGDRNGPVPEERGEPSLSSAPGVVEPPPIVVDPSGDPSAPPSPEGDPQGASTPDGVASGSPSAEKEMAARAAVAMMLQLLKALEKPIIEANTIVKPIPEGLYPIIAQSTYRVTVKMMPEDFNLVKYDNFVAIGAIGYQGVGAWLATHLAKKRDAQLSVPITTQAPRMTRPTPQAPLPPEPTEETQENGTTSIDSLFAGGRGGTARQRNPIPKNVAALFVDAA